MNTMRRRVVALEQKASPPPPTRWHFLRRYEDETDEQAIAAYEREHGSIGNDRLVMRVIISKPGCRPY